LKAKSKFFLDLCPFTRKKFASYGLKTPMDHKLTIIITISAIAAWAKFLKTGAQKLLISQRSPFLAPQPSLYGPPKDIPCREKTVRTNPLTQIAIIFQPPRLGAVYMALLRPDVTAML
jgi:hypothetical protein